MSKPRDVAQGDRDRKAVQLIYEYVMAEKASFAFGTIFLVLGQISDVTIPMFIGIIIDLLRQKKFDEIGKYCLIQFGIVLVSHCPLCLLSTFIDCRYLRGLKSYRLQHPQ